MLKTSEFLKPWIAGDGDDPLQPNERQLNRGSLNGGWKRHAVTRAVAGILLVFAPMPLTMFILSKLVDRSARIVWPQLLAGTICFLAYRFFVHRVEGRPMFEFGRKGAMRELGGGLLLGTVLACTLFGVLAMTGAYQLDGFNGMNVEIARRSGTAILAGFLEEMVLRGIVFAIIEQSLGSGLGVAGSAVLFGLLHLPSEGATVMGILNTIAGGVTLAAAYMATRRLWLPIGIHIAWNLTVGQIFSAVVSGHGSEPGLLLGRLTGPDWLTGGQFGIEGSLVSLLVDVVASTLLLRIAMKRGNLVALSRLRRVPS